MCGDLPLRIHDVQLPALAAAVTCDQGLDDLVGAFAFAQQPHTVDAVIGIDQGLRGDAADAGGDVRHPRADREKSRRDRDADLAGRIVAGDDRPGHISTCLSMICSENRFPLFRIMLYRPAA